MFGTASLVSAQVLIVPSEYWPYSRAVAAELREQMQDFRHGQLSVEVRTRDRLLLTDPAELSRYELIVTLGHAPALTVVELEKALPMRPPTLSLLVNKGGYEEAVPESWRTSKRSSTAIYLDQPFGRQLDLLQLALPDRTRIGVVFGPNSKSKEDDLRELGRARSLQFNFATIERSADVYPGVQGVLAQSDVFLALREAFDDSTAVGLLRASYSAGVPVMTYYRDMVRAGAILGLYSSNQQIARQASEVAKQILIEGTVPAPDYPRYYTVAVNATVARALGIRIESEAALTEALTRRERDIGEAPSRKPR
jgi:hypothetical protein